MVHHPQELRRQFCETQQGNHVLQHHHKCLDRVVVANNGCDITMVAVLPPPGMLSTTTPACTALPPLSAATMGSSQLERPAASPANVQQLENRLNQKLMGQELPPKSPSSRSMVTASPARASNTITHT